MVYSILFLIAGIFLLIKGADLFVEGASKIAKFFKIPSLIIGLTLVSIGTSLPELSVSVTASLAGNNGMSFGNVIGSNIFNIFVVVGISAIFTPLVVSKGMRNFDLPILLGIYLLLALFSFAITPFELQRWEGIIILVLFVSYLAFLVVRSLIENKNKSIEEKEYICELDETKLPEIKNKKIAVGITSILLYPFGVDRFLMGSKRGGKKAIMWTVLSIIFSFVGAPFLMVRSIKGIVKGIKALTMNEEEFINYVREVNTFVVKDEKEEETDEEKRPMILNIGFIILGVILIIAGGELVVDGASAIAKALCKLIGFTDENKLDLLIGLTVVAVGTSLPELVTSMVAAKKGENDIAIGNAVGSCLFNVLLILGVASTIVPMPLGPNTYIDVIVMFIAALLIFLFSFRKLRVNKIQGLIMVILYVIYLAYTVTIALAF